MPRSESPMPTAWWSCSATPKPMRRSSRWRAISLPRNGRRRSCSASSGRRQIAPLEVGTGLSVELAEMAGNHGRARGSGRSHARPRTRLRRPLPLQRRPDRRRHHAGDDDQRRPRRAVTDGGHGPRPAAGLDRGDGGCLGGPGRPRFGERAGHGLRARRGRRRRRHRARRPDRRRASGAAALVDDGSRRRISGVRRAARPASGFRPTVAADGHAPDGTVALDLDAAAPAGAAGLLRVRPQPAEGPERAQRAARTPARSTCPRRGPQPRRCPLCKARPSPRKPATVRRDAARRRALRSNSRIGWPTTAY